MVLDSGIPKLRKPKIVVFYKHLEEAGGAERHFVEECRLLEQFGADVYPLSYSVDKKAIFDLPIDQIDTVSGNSFTRLWKLRKKLTKLQPDLVVSSYGFYEINMALQGTGIPYAVYHHSPVLLHVGVPRDIPYSFIHRKSFPVIHDSKVGGKDLVPAKSPHSLLSRPKTLFKAILDRHTMRNAVSVFSNSHQTNWELEQMYGIKSVATRGGLTERIFKHEVSTDIRKVLGIGNRPTILSVNRLTAEKRTSVIIEAMTTILTEIPDACLLIGGTGPEELELQQLAIDLGISDSVVFLGFIPDSELWNYYAACDVFATPAWADYNITPYEALALGAYVVWSDEMEGWQEMESGKVLSASPNPKDFGKSVVKALSRPESHKPDLSSYLWENKIRPVFELALSLV